MGNHIYKKIYGEKTHISWENKWENQENWQEQLIFDGTNPWTQVMMI